MPRNSSGTYSLYTPGNPVVTSTVISSTWANNTLADLATALTDSLSRTGDGGMQAPLELDNGAIGAPGLTWATETTSGIYRNAAGDFRFSISATDVWRWTATGMVAGAATGGQQGAGTVNAKGFYVDGVALANSAGANPSAQIGLAAVNGVATTFLRSDGAPALSQAIVPTWTGIHTHAQTATGEQIRLARDNAFLSFYNSANSTRRGYILGSTGGAFTIGSEEAAQVIAFSTNAGAVTSDSPFRGPAGSPAAPTFSFNGATNLGLYAASATDVWMSLAGTGYPIGYRGMPSRTITTSDSTAATDNGRSILFTGAGSQTFTVDSDFGVASNLCVILNGGTGSLAIAESLGGTMTWLNGSGSLSTGSRTLAIGGIATIWMVDATNAYIWGTGIT